MLERKNRSVCFSRVVRCCEGLGRKSERKGSGMRLRWAASAAILVGILAGAASAAEGEALLQDGSYEVKVRLQIPNVWNWAADKTATICIADAAGTSDVPFSVLSGNNPLADCPIGNVRRDGARLSFEILCAGRDAARAHAAYTLMPRDFVGRIAMVMGAKNMTMTEVQVGRRVGDCDPAGAPQH
jgi:Protein of unknown function (DUF3617)